VAFDPIRLRPSSPPPPQGAGTHPRRTRRARRPARPLSVACSRTGRREPKLSQIDPRPALGITTADLLDPEPPNRRAALELAFDRIRETPGTGAGAPRAEGHRPGSGRGARTRRDLFEDRHQATSSDSVDTVRWRRGGGLPWLRRPGRIPGTRRTARSRVARASGHDGRSPHQPGPQRHRRPRRLHG
jgi:hypothetical protein